MHLSSSSPVEEKQLSRQIIIRLKPLERFRRGYTHHFLPIEYRANKPASPQDTTPRAIDVTLHGKTTRFIAKERFKMITMMVYGRLESRLEQSSVNRILITVQVSHAVE